MADAALIRSVARAAATRVPDGSIVLHKTHGGIAAYVEAGSPYNKAVGFGFDGVPAAAVMEGIEAMFAVRRAPLQFEVSSLGDPALVAMLTRRGYVLTGFENVLGLAIDPAEPPRPSASQGVRVTRVGPAESDVWTATMADAFLTPDVYDGPPSHDAIPRDVLTRIFGDSASAGFDRYLAWRGGDIAGGATFRAEGGVAQFCGAATLPGHRRRGVQSALLRHRLLEAARLGCDVAVVTTTPGSTSQANVQRAGFSLLYVRAIMTLAPAG